MSSAAPTEQLELISFVTCPFVQRAVIMLRFKNREFSTKFIDLRNKPEWFLARSPRGKVPLLGIGEDTVLFESQAICEYLDDAYKPALRSENLVERARERAFFSAAGEDYFGTLWQLETAASEVDFKAIKEKLDGLLDRLSGDLGERAFLSGDGTTFGFADVGFAPVFSRNRFFSKHFSVNLLEKWPNLLAWQERVLAIEAVANSLPDDWETSLLSATKEYKSFIAHAA